MSSQNGWIFKKPLIASWILPKPLKLKIKKELVSDNFLKRKKVSSV